MNTNQPTATATPNDLAPMSNDELLELYQQISSRVGMYNTEVLIQRMFEIRKELNRRMGELAEAKAEVARLGQNLAAIETAGGDEGASARMAMETRARVAELEQDKARLDWLEAEGSIRKDLHSWTAWGDKGVGNKTELRAAIDAARKGTE